MLVFGLDFKKARRRQWCDTRDVGHCTKSEKKMTLTWKLLGVGVISTGRSSCRQKWTIENSEHFSPKSH